MKAKRPKVPAPTASPLDEVSPGERDVLTRAYKTGLIVGWRRDAERGYRLTLRDRRDEYVEIGKLTSHLERLGRGAA
jgi:hypothetical protein